MVFEKNNHQGYWIVGRKWPIQIQILLWSTSSRPPMKNVQCSKMSPCQNAIDLTDLTYVNLGKEGHNGAHSVLVHNRLLGSPRLLLQEHKCNKTYPCQVAVRLYKYQLEQRRVKLSKHRFIQSWTLDIMCNKILLGNWDNEHIIEDGWSLNYTKSTNLIKLLGDQFLVINDAYQKIVDHPLNE